MNTSTAATQERWSARATELLERALEEHRDGQDAIPTATEALAALYRCQGESPGTAVLSAGELKLDEPTPDCTCPPELAARGGFASSCPAHGWGTG